MAFLRAQGASFRDIFMRTSACVCTCALTALCAAQGPPDPAALWERASLYRDEWGTPHVYGDDFFAMAFAFGYAQAQDHLEQMLFAYRVANGSAAAVAGEAYASSDEHALKLAHAALAARAYPHLSPRTQALCDGFAVGVNSWILEHPDQIPDWAEGVRPEDVLVLWHCYVMSFAPLDLPETWRRPPAAFTGNAWALAPTRTESEDAVLVINPHTHYGGPFQWYEAHLAVGGMDVAGATLFGLPVIVQGHNARLGWAFTPNDTDFADVYYTPPMTRKERKRVPEKLLEVAEAGIMMASEPLGYLVRREGGFEERTVPVLVLDEGPIIGSYQGQPCVWTAGGYRDFGALDQLVEMARANELAQFQQALRMHQIPCFHIVYADADGNIFYQYNVKAGTRQTAGGAILAPGAEDGDGLLEAGLLDWRRPVPTSNPLYMWRDVIPPDALPFVVNPPSGYVQACGNPPWTATGEALFAPRNWPPWLSYDQDSLRARRVRGMLSQGERTFEDVQMMLFDTLAPVAAVTVPGLIEAAAENPVRVEAGHPDLDPLLDQLGRWSYTAEADGVGMTLFRAWWDQFLRLSGRPWPSDELVRTFERNPERLQKLSIEAAEEAARFMRNEFGSLDVPWGDAHRLRRGQRQVALPGSGAGESVFTAAGRFNEGQWAVDYGYAFAMVVAFGDRPRAASVSPFGASSRPDSAHYADQMDLLADGRLKRTLFGRDDVARYAETVFGRVVRMSAPGINGDLTLRAEAPVTARRARVSGPAAALPPGTAAFTPPIHVAVEPQGTACQAQFRAHVPEEVCLDQDLAQLRIYARDETAGWQPLDTRREGADGRTFSAFDDGLRAYAVVGPATAHRGEPKPAVPGREPRPIVGGRSEPLNAPMLPAGAESELPEPDEPAAAGETAAAAVDQPEEEQPGPGAPPGLPSGRRSGPAVSWGREVRFELPEAGGVLEVRARKTVGVQVEVSQEAPALLPEGLAAMTPYVEAKCTVPGAVTSVSVHMQPAAGTSSAASARLYAYDTQDGWQELSGQELNDAGELSAVDTRVRTYVVLGADS